MNELILDIQNISKSFFTKVKTNKHESYEEEHVLLRNFELQIHKGQITCMIGGNGTGKTTLFNLINGFIAPDTGNIVYYGNSQARKLTKTPAHKIHRLGIGRLFQDNHIFENLSVEDNLSLAAHKQFGEKPFQAVFLKKQYRATIVNHHKLAEQKLVELFGENNKLWSMRKAFAGSLSFGEKRLLGLARLMMGDYQLVLLDEPTSGVNPVLFDSIANIIKTMKAKGMTVFMIEHNMAFVQKVADLCAFVNKGKIEETGTAKQILQKENVRKTYLGT